MASAAQLAVGRREFGLRSGQKALYLFFAVLLLGFGALFLLGGVSSSEGLAGAAVPAMIGLFFGFYLALTALRSRLILDGSRVTVQGPLRAQEFELNQI